jgi:Uma2 family endonuclease
VIVGTAKMTARQFLELGEDPPGVRLELVDGEVAVSPTPIPEHSRIVVALTSIVGPHVKKKRPGRLYIDVDTIFGEHDVRRPDLLHVSADRVHLIGKKAMEGSPDLCVEVLSPSSRTIDKKDKFRQSEAAGVAYYWIIDPRQRSMEAHQPKAKKYRAAGEGKGEDVVRLPPFPDLDIPLADLWEPED